MDRVRGDSDPVSLSGRRALISVSLATLVLDIGQRYKTKNLVRGHGPRNDLVSSINNYGTAKIRLNMSISREQQCILLQLVCKAFKHSSIFKRFPSFSLIHMLNRLRVPKCHEVARLWPLATE